MPGAPENLPYQNRISTAAAGVTALTAVRFVPQIRAAIEARVGAGRVPRTVTDIGLLGIRTATVIEITACVPQSSCATGRKNMAKPESSLNALLRGREVVRPYLLCRPRDAGTFPGVHPCCVTLLIDAEGDRQLFPHRHRHAVAGAGLEAPYLRLAQSRFIQLRVTAGFFQFHCADAAVGENVH